jgi:phage baseplate assembly protein gpV
MHTVGGTLRDILVDVELMPEGIDVTCRLSGGAGSQGFWVIPAEGDEVVVMMPQGDIAFMPVIVGLLSSYDVDNDGSQGPAPSRTVITNAAVYIHDGAGGAEELVKKSAYEAHIHSTGVGPSGTADNAASAASYTSVLKAK